MSFNRINNPSKREDEVKKYLALKEELKLKDRVEKTGVFGQEEALSKIFKPVTTATSQLRESLTQQLKALPGSIAQVIPPPLPMIGPGPISEVETGAEAIKDESGKITIPGDPELTSFIIKARNNKVKSLIDIDDQGILKINSKKLLIDNNNIYYEDEEKPYKRTKALLDLIFSENPEEESIKNKIAMKDYEEILLDSGVLFTKIKSGEIRPNPKLTQTDKWKRILRPIYEKNKPTKGKGLNDTSNNKTIILSSDPETLADRLTLLYASSQAGNTGVKNEIVEICNELIRKRVMTRKQRDLLLYDI